MRALLRRLFGGGDQRSDQEGDGEAADADAADADVDASDAADADVDASDAADDEEGAEPDDGSVWDLIPSWQYDGRHVETGGLTRGEQERALQDVQRQAEAIEADEALERDDVPDPHEE